MFLRFRHGTKLVFNLNRRWNFFLCKGSSLFQSTRVLHWGEMLILCFRNIIVHFSIELNIYSNETGNISTVVILIIIIYTLFKFQQQKLSTLLKYLLCLFFFFSFLVFPFLLLLVFLMMEAISQSLKFFTCTVKFDHKLVNYLDFFWVFLICLKRCGRNSLKQNFFLVCTSFPKKSEWRNPLNNLEGGSGENCYICVLSCTLHHTMKISLCYFLWSYNDNQQYLRHRRTDLFLRQGENRHNPYIC